MDKRKVIGVVEKYIKILEKEGIPVEKAFLYGSYAKGNAHKDSDIDVLIVSPVFDDGDDWIFGKTWVLTKYADTRIEPYAVGSRRFREDDVSLIVEIVRKEGIEIPAA